MQVSYGWIPDELKGVVTFFSEYDLWDYSNINYHTCQTCVGNSSTVYQGDELRSLFPFLAILDEDTIYPEVHPNCTCVMRRVTNGQDDRLIGKDVQADYDVPVAVEASSSYGFDFGGLNEFGGYW